MKLSQTQIKKLIKEEIKKVLKEENQQELYTLYNVYINSADGAPLKVFVQDGGEFVELKKPLYDVNYFEPYQTYVVTPNNKGVEMLKAQGDLF